MKIVYGVAVRLLTAILMADATGYLQTPVARPQISASTFLRLTIGLDPHRRLFKLPALTNDIPPSVAIIQKELKMAALQKLKYGLVTGTAVLLSASSAFAQEADAVHETKKITSNFVTLIKDAFAGGDKSDAAMKELMGILAPAVLTVAVCWISYIIASAIGRYIGNMVATKVDLTLGKFLTKAIRNLLMIVVAMGVLSYVGVDITGFAAALAAVSFAVGMALQGTLGNFASGIMLLLFRPFKVEDYIVVSDTEGTVEEIDLFTTRINTLDNRHVIVPNGEIFGSKLENYTRNELRRVDVSVGAEYSADLDRTRQALERAVMSISESEVSPPPQVYLVGLGGSSVDWSLRVWCKPQHYWGVREELTAAAKTQLDIAGIGIPFPQMDIHVISQMAAKAAA